MWARKHNHLFLVSKEQNTDNKEKEKVFPTHIWRRQDHPSFHIQTHSLPTQESLHRPSQSMYPTSSIIQWETKTLPKRMRTNLKAIFRISSILIDPSWLLILNGQTLSLSGTKKYIKIPIVFAVYIVRWHMQDSKSLCAFNHTHSQWSPWSLNHPYITGDHGKGSIHLLAGQRSVDWGQQSQSSSHLLRVRQVWSSGSGHFLRCNQPLFPLDTSSFLACTLG